MDQASSFKELGNKEYLARNYIRAIEYYTKAINVRPDPVFYTNRAVCNLELKRFQKALEDTQKAIELDKTYAKAYLRASQAYSHLGKLEDALDLIKKGIEHNPNEQQIRREYDNLQILIAYKTSLDKHIQDGEFADALRKVNSLLDRCETDIKLIDTKVEILCRSSDIKAAKEFLRSKESLLKQLSEEFLYSALAKVDRYANDLVNAKSNIHKALGLNPLSDLLKKDLQRVKSMEETKKKASDAFTAKKYDEALKWYDEAVSLDPGNKLWKSVMLSNKASCFMQQKKNKEALACMKASIELDPENAKYWYKKGKLEKDLNDWEGAEASMRKAKTLDPSLTIDNDLKEISKKVKELNKKDYYAVLGVDKKASADDIKKAYKDLVKKWHPDKHAGDKEKQEKATKKFKEISEAYNTLSDPDKRKKYDMVGMQSDSEAFAGFQDMGNSFGRGSSDPIIQMFFNNGSNNMFTFMSSRGATDRAQDARNPFGFSSFFTADDFSDDLFKQFRRR